MQQQAVKGFVTPELAAKNVAFHGERPARNLDNGLKSGRFTQDRRYSNKSLITDHANFQRLPIHRAGEVGDHCILRKENVIDSFADFVKQRSFLQKDRFQLWSNASIRSEERR